MTKRQWRFRDDVEPRRSTRSGTIYAEPGSTPRQSLVCPRPEHAEAAPETTEIRVADLIGRRIDKRYRVRGVIGRGGMGVVYDAVHEDLKRAVALKVMNVSAGAREVVATRFLREARIAAGFEHVNIVSILDYGQLPDGRPYLVMPRLRGSTFAQILKRQGPLTASVTAALLVGAAQALDHVHKREYVHRDVKTDNLMYAYGAGLGSRVVLLDFGIASVVHGDEPRLTAQGGVCGTLDYMSPEAAVGAAPHASADVYALATVAFELIAGEVPFPSNGLDTMAVLSRKITTDPPSLSQVTGRDYSRALEAALARGLSREPRLRFASAGEFVRALRSAARLPPPLPGRGRLRKRRSKPTRSLGELARDALARLLGGLGRALGRERPALDAEEE